VTTSADLLAGEAARWAAIGSHPFVVATADGSLPADTFDRWVVADHFFVVGFRRFLARLIELAPDEPARDLLAGALAPLGEELDQFRAWAADRRLDLDGEPGPVTLGYTSYLVALPADGWPPAVAALFGAEKAYLDAWSAVRRSVPASSPYRDFVDNWSSDAFRTWVDDVAALLDRTVPQPGPTVTLAFGRVVRFELRFWDAVHAGDAW
jgi:thiaminase